LLSALKIDLEGMKVADVTNGVAEKPKKEDGAGSG
jgi:hypothetical protein